MVLVFRKVGYFHLKRCLSHFAVKRSPSLDQNEIAHFQKLCENWWDSNNGPFKVLHTLNEIRVPFIIEEFCKHSGTQINSTSLPLTDRTILDVGCGGGILTEALAKRGAFIDGLDACPELINIAKLHAELSPSLTNLNYYDTTIEEHSITNNERYDAVIISEVIEHINAKEQFLESCIKCLKPKGSVFITTFNKTFWSWLVCVVLTQEIFNVIPRKTHDWEKFISPQDISKILHRYNCNTKTEKGFYLNFVNAKWYWTANNSFSYALHAIKK